MKLLEDSERRIQLPKMKTHHSFSALSVWIALSVFATCTSAQEPDFNEIMRKRWKDADVHKRHINGFDSPDGKLALFVFNPGDTTFSVTVMASADGGTFYRVLPLPSPDQTDDPSQKKSFSQVVNILWSTDSKHLAVHHSLSKHSMLHLFQVEAAALKDISPKNIHAVALKVASLDEAKVKSSGQPPERWVSPTVLRVQARFSTVGKVVSVPLDVVLGDGEATARPASEPKRDKK